MRNWSILVIALSVGLAAWADEPKKDKPAEPEKKLPDKAPEKVPEPKAPGKPDEVPPA